MGKSVRLDDLKTLREESGASVNDCRVALESSGGDLAKARAALRQRAGQIAQARQGRTTRQGRVEAYVHHDGRLAALVEVNCETDYVARTPEFSQFCRELAMHVAAMNPRFLQPEDIPSQGGASGEDVASACLLEQPFVKDQGTTVRELLKALIAKTGENVVIRRFVQFTVGESSSSAP
ncbi:MAG: elongation factor Ts [Candidatus Omnitrophota bacterium]|nr:elongation factor Ts [Candidatus Omnitrophota bacterium]